MTPADPSQAAAPRPSLLPVYITVFLDLLGFGIILPLLPFYAERFGATGLWIGAIVTAYSAAQFIGAPILGRASDRVGLPSHRWMSGVGRTRTSPSRPGSVR